MLDTSDFFPLSPRQFPCVAAQESYAERRHQLDRDGREDEGENGEIQDGGDDQVLETANLMHL